MTSISGVPVFHKGQAVKRIYDGGLAVILECYNSGNLEVRLMGGSNYIGTIKEFTPMLIAEKDPKKRNCIDCKDFGTFSNKCAICCIAAGFEFYDPKEKTMEKVAPDYSYNAEIIAAIKEGREVWSRHTQSGTWFRVVDPNAWNLIATYDHEWSLTKPKQKVIKNVETWSNKYKNGFGAFYSSEDEAMKNIGIGYIATIKLTGQYEVEE